MMNFDYRNVLNDLTSSGYYYIDPNITSTGSEGSFVIPSVFSLHDNNTNGDSDVKPCEVCGWLAAFCSMLAFGSFGVPIKSKIARSVDIDPLVFQSYKTAVCFVTAWLVLATGEEFSFTPWGIVSGIFWVPGGVATVYAIKAAGLAIGIGIGSSCIVLVSFIWGIFIFQEKVNSKFMACVAILCMMIGLFGMSYFSSQTASNNNTNNIVDSISTSTVQNLRHDVLQNDNFDDETNVATPSPIIDSTILGTGQHLRRRSFNRSDSDVAGTESSTVAAPRIHNYQGLNTNSVDEEDPTTTVGQNTEGAGPVPPYRHLSFAAYSSRSYNNNGFIDTATDTDDDTSNGDFGSSRGRVNRCNNTGEIDFIDFDEDGGMYIYCCNLYLTRRQRGMLSAAFCGLYGGSIMAPMKFAPPDTKGTHYLLSFAIGAAIVTLSLWVLRFLINSYYYGSFSVAYNALPSFHIHVMWLPGGISGLLWSIGNYFSLISVLYLGEGVGYPLVQTSILVSGLWGIFYFKEVQGYEQISKWLMSSLLTIFGILLLSYEHHAQ